MGSTLGPTLGPTLRPNLRPTFGVNISMPSQDDLGRGPACSGSALAHACSGSGSALAHQAQHWFMHAQAQAQLQRKRRPAARTCESKVGGGQNLKF